MDKAEFRQGHTKVKLEGELLQYLNEEITLR